MGIPREALDAAGASRPPAFDVDIPKADLLGDAVPDAERKLYDGLLKDETQKNPTGTPAEWHASALRRMAVEAPEPLPPLPAKMGVLEAVGAAANLQGSPRWRELPAEEQAIVELTGATSDVDSSVTAAHNVEDAAQRVINMGVGTAKVAAAPLAGGMIAGFKTATGEAGSPATEIYNIASEGVKQGLGALARQTVLVNGVPEVIESEPGRLLRVGGNALGALVTTPIHETAKAAGLISPEAERAELTENNPHITGRWESSWKTPGVDLGKYDPIKNTGDVFVRYAQDIAEGRDIQVTLTEMSRTAGYGPEDTVDVPGIGPVAPYSGAWWVGAAAGLYNFEALPLKAAGRAGAAVRAGAEMLDQTASPALMSKNIGREMLTPGGGIDGAEDAAAVYADALGTGTAFPIDRSTRDIMARQAQQEGVSLDRLEQMAREGIEGQKHGDEATPQGRAADAAFYNRPGEPVAAKGVEVEVEVDPTDANLTPEAPDNLVSEPPTATAKGPSPAQGERARRDGFVHRKQDIIRQQVEATSLSREMDPYENPDIPPDPAVDLVDTIARRVVAPASTGGGATVPTRPTPAPRETLNRSGEVNLPPGQDPRVESVLYIKGATRHEPPVRPRPGEPAVPKTEPRPASGGNGRGPGGARMKYNRRPRLVEAPPPAPVPAVPKPDPKFAQADAGHELAASMPTLEEQASWSALAMAEDPRIKSTGAIAYADDAPIRADLDDAVRNGRITRSDADAAMEAVLAEPAVRAKYQTLKAGETAWMDADAAERPGIKARHRETLASEQAGAPSQASQAPVTYPDELYARLRTGLGANRRAMPDQPASFVRSLVPDARPRDASVAMADPRNSARHSVAYDPTVRLSEPDVVDVSGKKYRVRDENGTLQGPPVSLAVAVQRLDESYRHQLAEVVVDGSYRPVAHWRKDQSGRKPIDIQPDVRGATVQEMDAIGAVDIKPLPAPPKAPRPKVRPRRRGGVAVPSMAELMGMKDRYFAWADRVGDAATDAAERASDRFAASSASDIIPTRTADVDDLTHAQETLVRLYRDAVRAKLRQRLGTHKLVPMAGVMVTPIEARRILARVKEDLHGLDPKHNLVAAFAKHGTVDGADMNRIELTREEANRFYALAGEGIDDEVAASFGTYEDIYDPVHQSDRARAYQSGRPFPTKEYGAGQREAGMQDRFFITPQQQRDMIDRLVKKHADRMTWDRNVMRTHTAWSRSVAALQRAPNEVLVKANSDAVRDYFGGDADFAHASPEVQALQGQLKRRLQTTSNRVHADIRDSMRAGETHIDAMVHAMDGSFEGLTPEVARLSNDLVRGSLKITSDSVGEMARTMIDADAAIMPLQLRKAMRGSDVERAGLAKVADDLEAAGLVDEAAKHRKLAESMPDPETAKASAVASWAEKRSSDQDALVREWLAANGVDGVHMDDVMRNADVPAIYDELYHDGNPNGDALDDALPVGAKRVEADAALATLVVRLRAKKEIERAIGELVERDLAISDPRVKSAVDAIIFGRDTLMVNGKRVTKVDDPASFAAAQQFIDRHGLHVGTYAGLRTLDGKTYLPHAFAESLQRASKFGTSDAAETGIASFPLVGPAVDKSYRLWKAATAGGLLIPNPANILGNIMGIPQTLTVTMGWGVGKQMTIPFDGAARGLAARLAFERSSQPVKIKGYEVNPVRHMVDYSGRGRVMRDKFGRFWTLDDLEREAMANGVDVSSARAETGQAIIDAIRRDDANLAQRMTSVDGWLGIANGWQDAVVEFSNAHEMLVRSAVFTDSIRQGFSPAEAGARARASLYDPTAGSPFERRIVRVAVPFWTWWRNNLLAVTKAAVQHPDRVAFWLRQRQVMERAQGIDEDQRRAQSERDALSWALVLGPEEIGNPPRPDFSNVRAGSPTMPIESGLWFMSQLVDAILTLSPSKVTDDMAAMANPVLVGGAELAFGKDLRAHSPLDSDKANQLPATLCELPAVSNIMLAAFGAGRRKIDKNDDNLLNADGYDPAIGYYRWVAGEGVSGSEFSDAERQTYQARWRLFNDLAGRAVGDTLPDLLQLVDPDYRSPWARQENKLALMRAIGFRLQPMATESRLLEQQRVRQARTLDDKRKGLD